MRKFTTLLALGCALCSTAFAAVIPGTKVDADQYQLTPEAKQMFSTMQARSAAGMDVTQGAQKIVKKTFEDNAYVWNAILVKNETLWCDVLSDVDGNHPSFFEFPYYWASYIVTGERKADGSRVTALSIPLLWPTQFIWEQSKEYLIQGLSPWDMPEADANMDIVTATEMFEATSAMQLGKSFIYSGSASPFYGDESQTWLGAFPVAPNAWYGESGWPQTYNGATTALKDNDQTKYSEITLDSWDEEEGTYKFVNTLYFENGATLNLTYNGEARLAGFVKEHYELPFLTEPQVFYVGEESGEELDMDNPYMVADWGPFSKFFVLGGTGNNTAVVRDGKNEFDMDWVSVLGVRPDNDDDPYGFYVGTLFKAAGTAHDDPYGWWNMKDPNIEYDERTGAYLSNDMVPRLNQLIPAGYDEGKMPWASTDNGDGFFAVKDGYYVYLQEYTRFCIGDEKYGLYLSGTDNFGNTYWGSYTGDIIMHTDPNDLSKTVTIPAMKPGFDSVEGIAADDVKVIANNGMITVVADQDVNAAVYTLSGALVKAADVKAGKTMNVAVEGGVYVVKAGNVAKKVAL